MRKIICIILVSLVGCSDPDTTADTDLATDPVSPPLTSTLILRDNFSQESNTYTQGESIEYSLSVANNTNSDIILNFGSSRQFDFYIQSAGTELWRSSDGLFFTFALTSLTIPANSSVIINEVWDQSFSNGSNIPIGGYSAFGSLLNQSPTDQYDFNIQ